MVRLPAGADDVNLLGIVIGSGCEKNKEKPNISM